MPKDWKRVQQRSKRPWDLPDYNEVLEYVRKIGEAALWRSHESKEKDRAPLHELSTPETRLEEVFKQILDSTADEKHRAVRETAVRWFSRLYYDVRTWNEGFVALLHSYPAAGSNESSYKLFLERLKRYTHDLESGASEHTLCDRIYVLAERFSVDFAWLKDENEERYFNIYALILLATQHRGHLIDAAGTLSNMLHRLLYQQEHFFDYKGTRAGWHVKHHETVIKRIQRYELESREAVERLHVLAVRAGAALMSVEQYDVAVRINESFNNNAVQESTVNSVREQSSGTHKTAAEAIAVAKQVLDDLKLKSVSKADVLGQLDAISDELERPTPDRKRMHQALEIIRNVAAPVAAALPIKFQSCFISYSTKDDAFAAKLSTDLEMRGVRIWFAPHDIKSGKKLHEQIKGAIEVHDRVLLVLSEHSMESEWVKTEIASARKREIVEKRQILFPIRISGFERIREWESFDADIGKDSAREIREYFIPDFSNWNDSKGYEDAFERLLQDLNRNDAER